MKNNNLFGKDILSADQFTRDDIEMVIERSIKMREIVKTKGATDILHDKIMAALFYEPSSRTYGSFIAAIQRLGGGFIPLQGISYSSVAKGETLNDTVATFASYSDVIVFRHPQVGAAKLASDSTTIPIINAGDGPGEHPTQALLDIFTIIDHFGTVDGKTVTLVGDLLNGRTVHSLITLLLLYKPKLIQLVAPEELRMPANTVKRIKNAKISVVETESLDEILANTDALYVTRVQKERFQNLTVYEKLKDRFVITRETMKHLASDAILMHPFPRITEIATEVDSDSRALYLREQITNGMYVRMALLSLVLQK
jgi:aspartate carbamoyltransferase catalytic subunit